MESLELISKIALIALFAALTVLCIYVIVSLRKLTSALQNIEHNVEDISEKLSPVLENAAVVSSNLKEITTGAKVQVEKLGSVVDSVKDTADSIIELEQKAQKQIEGHVFDILNLISSISKGVKTFLTTLKRTNGSSSQPAKHLGEEGKTGRHLKSYSPLDSSEEEF
jgi:uncharacterized protein YoxC